jgi:hypothetical protein
MLARRDRKGSVSGNGVVGCSSARPALVCDTTEYRCADNGGKQRVGNLDTAQREIAANCVLSNQKYCQSHR